MRATRLIQIAAAAAVVLANVVFAPALADALYVQRRSTALDSAAGVMPAAEELDVAACIGRLPSGVNFVDMFAQ